MNLKKYSSFAIFLCFAVQSFIIIGVTIVAFRTGQYFPMSSLTLMTGANSAGTLMFIGWYMSEKASVSDQ